MAEVKKKRSRAPARSDEARESQLINLALLQAEKMLESGNAPAQIITHFLKLGTERAKYEREKLQAETELAVAKAEVMKSQKRSEELFEKAIVAFRSYGGISQEDEDDYYD